MGPLLPDGLDLSASLDRSTEVCTGAPVAHDLAVCDRHGRVVVGPLTLDGLRAGGRGEAFVTWVGGSINHVGRNSAMGRGLGSEKGNSSDGAGEQHLDWNV